VTTQTLTSPRIARLAQEVDRAGGTAAERFMSELETAGAPLIEPNGGDNGHSLVTFVWRDTGCRNVALVGGPASLDAAKNLLTRLPGSDVWHRTYRLRDDVRTVYSFSPDDPLVDLTGKTLIERQAYYESRLPAWLRDPLNPKTFDTKTPGMAPRSIIEMPSAPAQPYVERRPEVVAGELHPHRFESAIFGRPWVVWAYTPPGYDEEHEPYGLLFLFDGFAYVYLVPAPVILDNLLAERLVPPMVAIMVQGADRNEELPCNPRLTDFLAQELMPWVRERYNVTSDPARVIVAGSSYGGLAAAYCGLRLPHIFGNVLSQSGSFWWRPAGDPQHSWPVRQFAVAPKLDLRFYLDVGSLEASPPTAEGGPNMVAANRHMRDVLVEKGYDVTYAEFSGGHDYICWRGTLSDGLISLTNPKPA
jgi:enterochelin esterase family protein